MFGPGSQARVHRETAGVAPHNGIRRHEHDTIKVAHGPLDADTYQDNELARRRSIARSESVQIEGYTGQHNCHLKLFITISITHREPIPSYCCPKMFHNQASYLTLNLKGRLCFLHSFQCNINFALPELLQAPSCHAHEAPKRLFYSG